MPRSNYVIHEREPKDWWDDGTPERRRRAQAHRPSKLVLGLLLVIVGVVTAFTLIYMDLRRDMQAANSPAPTQSPPPSVIFDKDLPSIDTIAENLAKKGFEVTPLIDFTDQQGFAYEAGETKIDGVGAYILAFKDVETTKTWAESLDAFNGIGVVGDNWGISLDSDKDDQKSKALAEKIAGKIGGRAQWRPEGE